MYFVLQLKAKQKWNKIKTILVRLLKNPHRFNVYSTKKLYDAFLE